MWKINSLDQSEAQIQKHLKIDVVHLPNLGQPRISFDLKAKGYMNHLDININKIGRSWCQTIGNSGQKTQISHPFQEIFIAKLKLIRRSKSY